MDARAALIQALNNYDGCVILVSHDPHLVEAVVDQLWLVCDGSVERYSGNLEEYRQLVIDQRKRERSGTKKEKDTASGKGGKKAKGKGSTSQAEKVSPALEQLRGEMQALEQDLGSEKALNNQGYMNELLKRYAKAQKDYDAAETAWLEAQ
jgi:ATP-binding cassette, subfamily F, member 3